MPRIYRGEQQHQCTRARIRLTFQCTGQAVPMYEATLSLSAVGAEGGVPVTLCETRRTTCVSRGGHHYLAVFCAGANVPGVCVRGWRQLFLVRAERLATTVPGACREAGDNCSWCRAEGVGCCGLTLTSGKFAAVFFLQGCCDFE